MPHGIALGTVCTHGVGTVVNAASGGEDDGHGGTAPGGVAHVDNPLCSGAVGMVAGIDGGPWVTGSVD